MSLEWRDEMSVGNEDIDNDHKHLLDLIGTYQDAVAHHDLTQLQEVFESLVAYTEEHFAREERIMFAVHYKELDEHRTAHHALYQSIHQLHDNIVERKKGALDLSGINKLLHDWVLDHILKEDMKLKDVLKGRKIPGVKSLAKTPWGWDGVG